MDTLHFIYAMSTLHCSVFHWIEVLLSIGSPLLASWYLAALLLASLLIAHLRASGLPPLGHHVGLVMTPHARVVGWWCRWTVVRPPGYFCVVVVQVGQGVVALDDFLLGPLPLPVLVQFVQPVHDHLDCQDDQDHLPRGWLVERAHVLLVQVSSEGLDTLVIKVAVARWLSGSHLVERFQVKPSSSVEW